MQKHQGRTLATCSLLQTRHSWHPRHSRKSFGHIAHKLLHTAAAHHVHHLARLLKLLDEAVYFLNRMSAASGNALFAALIQDFGVLTLFRSHGKDNGFDAAEGTIVDIYILDGL